MGRERGENFACVGKRCEVAVGIEQLLPVGWREGEDERGDCVVQCVRGHDGEILALE